MITRQIELNVAYWFATTMYIHNTKNHLPMLRNLKPRKGCSILILHNSEGNAMNAMEFFDEV